MDVLEAAAWGAAGIAVAVAGEAVAARLVRAVLLAREPLSGEHIDSAVYHRSLWTPGQPALWPARLALLASGLLLAAGPRVGGWLGGPALLAWSAALAWDLWTWERVAASVKFVTWRRGWQRSARRVAVSQLREVLICSRRRPHALLRAGWQPDAAQLVLRLRDGSGAQLPATLTWFGGERRLEDVAGFIRLQMDVVADNRRRAAADKRAAARRAHQAPPSPLHPTARIDPLALPRAPG
jgi:hypothetical protein